MSEENEYNFNRIVIVGNGFDLALGLKTGYKDFMNWLFLSEMNVWLEDIKNTSVFFEFKCQPLINANHILVFRKMIQQFEGRLNSEDPPSTFDELVETLSLYDFSYTYKSDFLGKIYKELNHYGWVNLEARYYKDLCFLARAIQHKNLQGVDSTTNTLIGLNKIWAELSVKLKEYLILVDSELSAKMIKSTLKDLVPLIERKIPFVDPDIADYDYKRNNIFFINFNYTSTIQHWINANLCFKNGVEVNHIHGHLSDEELIFGYGDDQDINYTDIESIEDNMFMHYLKSSRYGMTNKYDQLLGYLELGKFEVAILGHSCGLSDKTLLSTLFQHKYCMNIRPFERAGKDHYLEKHINIARHFTDKAMMRERVCSYDENYVIPQAKEELKSKRPSALPEEFNVND